MKCIEVFILCLYVTNSLTTAVPLRCVVDLMKKTVDCSGLHLSTSTVLVRPDEGKLIEKINYSNNNIVRVEGLYRFPNVKELDFQLNTIENISSSAFSALAKLNNVDLSYNNIEVIDPYLFIKNEELVRLSLQGNLLAVNVDKPILCSASLQVLNLGTCALSTLTRENLLCVPALTELDLRSNGLTSLSPSAFLPLHNLVTINLRTNRFPCDCKLPELLNWARSKKSDMSSPDPVYCVLPDNKGRAEFEKVKNQLNCSTLENAVTSSPLKAQNENSSSEFYDYILISYDSNLQSTDGRVSTRYMGIISNKLYTIEGLLSLVLFLLVVITGMLFCRHNRTVAVVSDTMSEYSGYETFLSDKMSAHLLTNNQKNRL